MGPSPSRDLAHFAGLEDKFCKDFSCCGKQLLDLHDLLQHFEENHVCLESDMEGDDLPFEFESMDESGDDYVYQKTQPQPTQAVCLADICAQGFSSPLNAFDTNVVRKRPAVKPWRKQPSPEQPQTIPLKLDGPTHVINENEEMMQVDEKPTTEEGRPYKCKVTGCTKAYKNPGGLKYHMQHGHCEDTGDPEMNNIIHKPYQCTVPDCGKRYKNLNGLKVVYIHLVSY